MMIEDVETDGDADEVEHEEVSDGIVQVDMTFKLLARRLSGNRNERPSKPTRIAADCSEPFPGENRIFALSGAKTSSRPLRCRFAG